MKKQGIKTSNYSNGNRRNNSSNIRTTNAQRGSVSQKKSTMPNSRTRNSLNKERTYTSRNKSSINTNVSARRNNQKTSQNWGLWFTKLTIQIALCILFYFAVYAIVTDYAKESYDFAYQVFGDVCVEPSSEKK